MGDGGIKLLSLGFTRRFQVSMGTCAQVVGQLAVLDAASLDQLRYCILYTSNCTVFITNRRCGYRQSIGIGGGGMGAERGENAHLQMRQGWLLGDWIEVLNDAGDELQLHPFLHLLVDTAE